MHRKSSPIGPYQRGIIRIEIFVLAMLMASLVVVLMVDLKTSRPAESTIVVQSEPSHVVPKLVAEGQSTDTLKLQSMAHKEPEIH